MSEGREWERCGNRRLANGRREWGSGTGKIMGRRVEFYIKHYAPENDVN